MQNHASHRILISILATSLGVSGCTYLEGYFEPAPVQEQTVELPPPVERPRLDPLNRNYFQLETDQQSVIGEPQLMFSSADNTFSDIAREYGLGYDELVAANPDIDPWLPGENTPIVLPTQYVLPDVPYEGIVLNIASKRLFYFPQAAEGEAPYVMTFPIGIGRVGWETPLGDAEVISKARDPQWYVPSSVRREHEEAGDPLPAIVPPGPDNPLGKFVLKLDMPGYLIHGTNQPYGVGMRVSHGCVRLYPENIELLYSLVENGETVKIINEPYLAGWRDGELYFESHTPLEDDEIVPERHLHNVLTAAAERYGAFQDKAQQDQARAIASGESGMPIRVNQGDEAEVLERVRIVRNTVVIDPDMPTLAEVRELLDTPPEDEAVEDTGESPPPVPSLEQSVNDE